MNLPAASSRVLCTDDATEKPLYGLFRVQEGDLDGCFAVCQAVFTRSGLPV